MNDPQQDSGRFVFDCATTYPLKRRLLRRAQALLFVVACLPAMPVGGQHLSPAPAGTEATDPAGACLTTRLLDSEEGREALRAFSSTPRSDAPRTMVSQLSEVGDTLTFNVRTKVALDVSEHEWKEKTFVLKARETNSFTSATGQSFGFQIWVESIEWDAGRVNASDIEVVRRALHELTPSASINPNAGIIRNEFLTFGLPPNYDGDRLVDFLLTDIVEGTAGGVINGFFDPNDINPNLAGSNRTNQRDILYLDTRPTLSIGAEKLLETVAHELQHLIHAEHDADETTFVNEGQSEWAQLLTGYGIREVNYLLGGSASYNVPLLVWDRDEPLPEYERAGLWTNYLADQLGPELVGAITREAANGLSGYRNVLRAMAPSTAIEALVADFHTANLVNDAGIDRRFAYFAPQRDPFGVAPEYIFNGGETSETPVTALTLEPGGVEYLTWRSVRDPVLRIDVSGAFRNRVSGRAVLERDDATLDVVDLDLRSNEHPFEGDFERVSLVLTQHDLASGPTGVLVSAQWSSRDVRYAEIRYDTGSWELFFSPGDVATSAYATRFERPEAEGEVVLNRVFLPNYFSSQFSGGADSNSDRSYRFAIWGDDGSGKPGEELFLLDLVDTRPFEYVRTNDPLKHIDLDLSGYRSQLASLPETIYIGSTNVPLSVDYIAIPLSTYTAENLSFVRGRTTTWNRMWDLSTGTNVPLKNHLAPVRAEFLVDERTVQVAPDGPEPEALALEPNFPNPFAQLTALPFVVPTSAMVRLTAYDVLGRRVGLFVDEWLEPGRHVAWIDASGWAPGAYVVVLEAGDRRVDRLVTVSR